MAVLTVLIPIVACQIREREGEGKSISRPMVQSIPKKLVAHGHTRIDPYYWLRRRDDKEVVAYLEAENEHAREILAHARGLEDTLFEEIKGRIKQTDSTAPHRDGAYYYYTRFEDGREYPIYCRKREALDRPEEILADANTLAEGHDFFDIGRRSISFGEDILAFAVDTRGRRIYTIRFKDLKTGRLLEEEIPEVTGNMAWANDNRTLFYSRQDPGTLRSHRIYRHELGSLPSEDELVYEETDETFAVYVFKTKSRAFLMLASRQTLSSEYRYLSADRPRGKFEIIQPRERDHEYHVDHLGDRFYVRTNWNAKNFRLMETPVERPGKDAWKEIVPHRDDTLLRGIELFADHLVLEERHGGLVNIRIREWSGPEHVIDFGESTYDAGIDVNRVMDTKLLRYSYTSMTTPRTFIDYDMKSREKTVIKRDEILGGFQQGDYETDRLHARASDGSRIPISIVYRKGLERDGSRPLLLYGYGSYGHSLDAGFSAARVSLLDRGFAYAIAHVRGGQELGRSWYEDGKLLKKKNTFTDFIACAEHLIREGYTRTDRLFAMGGSAGGLLIGAVINLRPELFHGAVAHVPFVDVVTTMLDDSIPLTTSEYDEWGNPNDKTYYDYMLSYSPYDRVENKDYPHLLVTAGLHDSQVQYWEPAKWVAKLRAMKTDDRRLLLKTNMEAGHGGASGRYRRYRETAFEYTFLLDLAGIRD